MPRFRITYLSPDADCPDPLCARPDDRGCPDPKCSRWITVEHEFHDTTAGGVVTAREWAEDWAYTAADKGPYTVELLPEAADRFHLESTGPNRFRLRTRH